MITLRPTFWSYYMKKITKQQVKQLFSDIRAEFEKPKTPPKNDGSSIIEKLKNLGLIKESNLEKLNGKGYTSTHLENLKKMIHAEDSDMFDVLANVAFDTKPVKRSKRVEVAKSKFGVYSSTQRELIEFIADQYDRTGEGELEEAKISDHIVLKYGSIEDGKQILGDLKDIRDLYFGFQKHLYQGRD